MPSTSSSARLAEMPAYPAAVFAVAFLGTVIATDAAHRSIPALQGPAQPVVQAERPSDGDHYLANDAGGHIDHHVIFFGIDAEVLERLRAAEVLFLGNSRLMFALRPEETRPWFDAQGVSYYVMGFGFREADRFPLAIIRKFDLRPRLVVVNADGFFDGGLSEWADAVNRDTPFAARKLQIEAEGAHRAREVVHKVVPNWLGLHGLPGLALPRRFIIYRSRQDGTWEIPSWPEGTESFLAPRPEGDALGRPEVAAARAFKAELDARGSRLVLTRVPTPEPFRGAGPERFAALLDVPLVLADAPALTTHDRSHLSQGSAHDWSRAFLSALAPHVRAVRLPGADAR